MNAINNRLMTYFSGFSQSRSWPFNSTVKKVVGVVAIFFVSVYLLKEVWQSLRSRQISDSSDTTPQLREELLASSLQKKSALNIPDFLNDPTITTLILNGEQIPKIDLWANPSFQTRLEMLGLELSVFITIPSQILSTYTALKVLDLRGCLTNPLDLRGCRANSEIENMGEKLKACPSLKELYLMCTWLLHLPNNLNELPCLEILWCGRNGSLNNIPTSIGDCRYLKELHIDANEALMHLPDEILSLPRSCKIFITLTTLTPSTYQRIQKAISNEEYQGPKFVDFSTAVS